MYYNKSKKVSTHYKLNYLTYLQVHKLKKNMSFRQKYFRIINANFIKNLAIEKFI